MSMIKKLAVGLGAMVMSATISSTAAAGNQPPTTPPVTGGGTGGCNGQPVCGGTKPEPVKPTPITATGTATSGSTSAAEAAAAAEAKAKAAAAANAEGGRSSLHQETNYEAAAAPVVLGSDGSGYCTKGKAGGISLVQVGVSARGYAPDMDCVETVAQYDLAEDALKETFKAVKDGIATHEAAGVAFAGTVAMLPKWKEAQEAGTGAYANMFMSQSRAVSITPPAGPAVKATEQGIPDCQKGTRWDSVKQSCVGGMSY